VYFYQFHFNAIYGQCVQKQTAKRRLKDVEKLKCES
jgi:hypothetical protein